MAIPYSRTIIGELPWYSVLVVTGIVLAVWLAGREEKRLGLPKDTAVDLALIVLPCGIAGARLYYVLMRWEAFSADLMQIMYIWQGGLAIYGGVIGGALGTWLYARRRKIRFSALADMLAPGLLLAQAVGRWGNYFNMEAYGPVLTETSLQFFPVAVLIPEKTGYVWHAATFFYESLWNGIGFAALWFLRKKQHNQGAVFAWYLLIYGAGRFVIEQLRTDSLYIGGLRASQYLSLALCLAAAWWLLKQRFKGKKTEWRMAVSCCALWFVRWAALNQPLFYAGLLMTAGVLAIWIKRSRRKALLGIGAVCLTDGLGLLASLFCSSAIVGTAVHAALCSITLPAGVYALCAEEE